MATARARAPDTRRELVRKDTLVSWFAKIIGVKPSTWDRFLNGTILELALTRITKEDYKKYTVNSSKKTKKIQEDKDIFEHALQYVNDQVLDSKKYNLEYSKFRESYFLPTSDFLRLIEDLVILYTKKYGTDEYGEYAERYLLENINKTMPSALHANNFDSDWRDGVRLAGLAYTAFPRTFPHWTTLDPKNDTENIQSVMQLASSIGIHQLMEPADMNDENTPKICILAYISQFFKDLFVKRDSIFLMNEEKMDNLQREVKALQSTLQERKSQNQDDNVCDTLDSVEKDKKETKVKDYERIPEVTKNVQPPAPPPLRRQNQTEGPDKGSIDNKAVPHMQEPYAVIRKVLPPDEILTAEDIQKKSNITRKVSIKFANEPRAASCSELSQIAKSNNSVHKEIIEPGIFEVRRVLLQNDLINIFKDPKISNQSVTFIIKDERGNDDEGVSRDVYAEFWTSFIRSSSRGEEDCVPTHLESYASREWMAIGRILLKGLTDVGYFPLQLSKAFLIAMLHGSDAVDNEILWTSFLHYITTPEKDSITRTIEGEDDEEDNEIIEDLVCRMECRAVPEKEELRSFLLNVAHKEIIQDSKFAMDEIAKTAKDGLLNILPDMDSILQLYGTKTPNAKKVIALMDFTVTSAQEEKIRGFLKQYIRSLDQKHLRKFLRFVTGSDVICVEKIDITFTTPATDVTRVPIAHTCGPALEIPKTYKSFSQMKAEFNSILESNFLTMDIE